MVVRLLEMVMEQYLQDVLVFDIVVVVGFCYCHFFVCLCFFFLQELPNDQTSGLQRKKGCDEIWCLQHRFIPCTTCIMTMSMLDVFYSVVKR